MKNFCLLVLFGLVTGTLLARIESAYGVAPFKKQFEEKYVKKDPSTPEEKALAAAVTKAKCNICHVGKKKKDRNAYGNALDVLLDRKTDAKNTAKIQAALDQVAAMKSNPDDPNSPTFGELIKQGKLPGGEEPTQSAAK
jgi:cytochrome c2